MENLISKVKTFTDWNHQPSAWSDNNQDYGVIYALINNRWYRLTDIEAVVGENHDGSLCPIKKEHLDRFTEERTVGFYSI